MHGEVGIHLTSRSRIASNGGTRALSLKGGQPAAMRVSRARANDTLVAGSSFLIVVQIDPKVPASLRVSQVNLREIDVELSDGDVCLLSPGSVVSQRSASCGQLIYYRIPKQSIKTLASDRLNLRVDSLDTPRFTKDPVLHLLSRVVCPLLESDRRSSKNASLTETFTLSFYCHLLERYGSSTSAAEQFTGGLSPGHRRLVEEALSSIHEPRLGLNKLAKQCELSTGHFARAFRETYGVSFHKYQMSLRAQRAKKLLAETTMTLREIAVTLGYADQATFTERFTRSVGTAPGRFRRRYSVVDEEWPVPRREEGASRSKDVVGIMTQKVSSSKATN